MVSRLFDGSSAHVSHIPGSTGKQWGSALACGMVDRNKNSDLVMGVPLMDVNGQVDSGFTFILFQ